MDNYDEYGNFIGNLEDDSDVESAGDEQAQPSAQASTAPRAYDDETVAGDFEELEGMEVDGKLCPSSVACAHAAKRKNNSLAARSQGPDCGGCEASLTRADQPLCTVM